MIKDFLRNNGFKLAVFSIMAVTSALIFLTVGGYDGSNGNHGHLIEACRHHCG